MYSKLALKHWGPSYSRTTRTACKRPVAGALAALQACPRRSVTAADCLCTGCKRCRSTAAAAPATAQCLLRSTWLQPVPWRITKINGSSALAGVWAHAWLSRAVVSHCSALCCLHNSRPQRCNRRPHSALPSRRSLIHNPGFEYAEAVQPCFIKGYRRVFYQGCGAAEERPKQERRRGDRTDLLPTQLFTPAACLWVSDLAGRPTTAACPRRLGAP